MMLRPGTSRQYGGRTAARVAAFEVPAVVACRARACRLLLRLPANRPVGELADQVGLPVVAGVLLDHVDVDPLQGAGFTYPGEAGVAETAGSGRHPARLALGLPCRQVSFPLGAVQGEPSRCLRWRGRTR